MPNVNELGQPIGAAVSGWKGALEPDRAAMTGTRCRLEPLRAEKHADALHLAHLENRDASNWTYLPYGPFASAADFGKWMSGVQDVDDPYFFAIVDLAAQTPIGVASFLRAVPLVGTIEVGHLNYSPALQGTVLSTEAMYLMMRRVFDDWGYRRYEWKCHSLNAPSLAAARRLGFRFEGLFRNHFVVKGRNRDTAWLSVIDSEWPAIRTAMEAWLEPGNFDEKGAQRKRLGDFMPSTAGQPIVVDSGSR